MNRVLARTPVRLAFLLPAAVAMLAALDAALLLLGLPAPINFDRLPDLHGPLMIFSFVGTLIALERAVALARPWAYAAPAFLGVGGLLLLSPAPLIVGKVAIIVGAAAQIAIYRGFWRRHSAVYLAVQTLGAIQFLGAAILWLADVPFATLVPWLAGFLILTIGGERLELSRIGVMRGADHRLVYAVALAVVAAPALGLLWPAVGLPLFGAALIALVVAVGRIDVALRTITATGAPRYMAACLLAGYVWLAGAGGAWLVLGPITEGRAYDGVLHAVFLGFVFSMIMAHASVILPAVLRRPVPYRPAFWAPVVLLHVSLALRLLVGDAQDLGAIVQLGGALNVLAILLFVGVAATSTLLGEPRPAVSRLEAAK